MQLPTAGAVGVGGLGPLHVPPPAISANPVYFKTPFMGYACEWSPFEENKLAIASAQHFGVVGNGKQHVIRVNTQALRAKQSKGLAPQQINAPMFKDLAIYNTRDGVYDCAWSELNENHIVSACGDGTLRLWDMGSPKNPLRAYQGHNAEVYTVEWNLVNKQHFLSGFLLRHIALHKKCETKKRSL